MRTEVAFFGGVLVAALLIGCTSNTVNQAQYSGFLPSYEGLTTVKTTSGRTALRWTAPEFNVANYDRLIYQPISFHPKPSPTDRISEQTYYDLLKYANTRLSQAFAERFQLVSSSAPHTLVFRGAITGVNTETEGLKPYEIIPVALVIAGAMAATGERDQSAELLLEGEFIDASTGAPLMRVVRKGFGKTLDNSKQAVTAADLKPVINELTADVLKFH